MSTLDFNTFIRAYQVEKDSDKSINITNARIGDKSLSIYGGKFSIPELDYPGFLKKYVREVVEKGEMEYLTEFQMVSDGPILVDLDFHFPYETTERQYTEDHVIDLVGAYVEEITRAFQFDDGSSYQIYVLEKSKVNRVEKKNITKDGIHLIIGINAERRMQILLREKMMAKLQEMWSDFPIINTWGEVLDEVISNGTTGWQLYGSTKPGCEPYQLTQIYTVGYDPNDGQPIINCRSKNDANWKPNWQELVPKMSARHRGHPGFCYRSDFIRELDSVVVPNRKMKSGGPAATATTTTGTDSSKFTTATLNARSQSDLDQVLEDFIEENKQQHRWDWNELIWHTMALPEKHFGPYANWIRVGMALKHTSPALFVVWMAFSAKSASFDYGEISTYLNKWDSFETRNEGLTSKSIIYWCKSDVPKKYTEVKLRVAESTLERAMGGYEDVDEDAKVLDRKGTTDYDLACVLHSMYGDDYVCVDIQNNKWYKYEEPRWAQIDAGVGLRLAISCQLRALYTKKMIEYAALRDTLSEDEDPRKTKKLQKYCDKLVRVCERLGSTNDKNNIMTESRHLFHDPHFEKKLDTNPYLLCFQNGVVDFTAKTPESKFRRGAPEDYLTKCTNINYVPIDPLIHRTVIDEIKDFMRKLFPESELCEYMWNHLAATMTGLVSISQTFNIYIGGGQNGKSVLIKLMDSVLGEYKVTMSVNMLTDRRGKVGSATPEMMALKGSRMAVAQEPQKGERLNDGVVKEFSSGEDKLQGRALYSGKMVEFLPQFQLVICTNYLPEITSNDHGIWRRVRVCPFKSLFTDEPVSNDPEKPYQFKIDRKISQRMEYWKEVFASMLVERAYVNQGMVPDCNIVTSASNAYRQSQDCIAEFINDRVIIDASGNGNGTITQTELNETFKNWYDNAYGRKSGPNIKEVRTEMDKRFKKFGKVWIGVRISYESDMNGLVDDDDVPEPNAF